MITVIFTQKGQKLSLLLEGHAGYAVEGQDIVCASASILAYTLASIVESSGVEYTIELAPGDSAIECECNDQVRSAFAYTKVGYALLEQNYPQYVSLLDLT